MNSEKKVDILVVEDHPIDLKYMEDILEQIDLSVHTCTNGTDALESLLKLKPRLMILDLNLPDLNGDKVLIKISELMAWSNLSTFIVTGNDLTEEDKIKIHTLGAEKSFCKPVDPTLFRQEIRALFIGDW
ncbi:hypothetical protein A9Q84_15970 [Halobacteriovorax marinus]|uniref:Response regulatory domain-containing protein n=1 Tax=Halobacteriovorax marinus TaxID=97084 RepID=A0A1Y5F425_9BACT|nr:hypothetical protein A9Q84_15970 [Halobacteriovorax marinus]